jgi:glycosyltransferase involved in cell wall biosynthesis
MLNTEAGSGGAARAMQRLAQGLRGRGHHVDVLVAGEATDTGAEITLLPDAADPGRAFAKVASVALDYSYVAARRTSISNTSFSTQPCGFDLASLPRMASYDVVNVHWTGGIQSPHSLSRLIDTGMPLVFTLHDMAHFTGGCHYSAGCRSFEGECDPCHQVTPDELGLIPHSIHMKRAAYGRPNVRAVAPSAWLAEEARRSRVFQDPVATIPNAIEAQVFRLRDREAIRAQMGLSPDTCAILFGVYDNGEKRKGFAELLAALKLCLEDPAFAARAEAGLVRLILFGKTQDELASIGIPRIDLGWVSDDERLSEIYNAADICVLPSLEDNQPNVMLEAMACGTPVIAFRIGGIPETVSSGENGLLVEPFDIPALATAISQAVAEPSRMAELSQAAAASASTFTLDRQGEAYEKLFWSLVSATGRSPAKAAVIEADLKESRSLTVPYVLDPVIEAMPVGPILASQIAELATELDEVKENRAAVHEQLLDVTRELVAVTQNRDILHGQLVAISEHSAARDAELALLKDKILNRLILKIRNKIIERRSR